MTEYKKKWRVIRKELLIRQIYMKNLRIGNFVLNETDSVIEISYKDLLKNKYNPIKITYEWLIKFGFTGQDPNDPSKFSQKGSIRVINECELWYSSNETKEQEEQQIKEKEKLKKEISLAISLEDYEKAVKIKKELDLLNNINSHNFQFIKKLKYIHELQNLYYELAGGEELKLSDQDFLFEEFLSNAKRTPENIIEIFILKNIDKWRLMRRISTEKFKNDVIEYFGKKQPSMIKINAEIQNYCDSKLIHYIKEHQWTFKGIHVKGKLIGNSLEDSFDDAEKLQHMP